MKIQKINPNKMKKFFKKFFASIMLAIFGLSMFVPVTHALQNENYKFLEGGEPMWIDYPYDMSFGTAEGNLTLSGSLYAKYNPVLKNFVPYSIPLKGESAYKGLAGWNGIIFVEPKKLQPGINKILYADYFGHFPEKYITNKDKSMFGIDVLCGENDICTMNVYAGNDWSFPNDFSLGNGKFKNKTLNNGNMTLVKDFTINRTTSPDFLIYASIEYSHKYNEETQLAESRIKLAVDVETEPGSGIMKKVTETTRITGLFPSSLYRNMAIPNNAIELKFFDYTKAYSLDGFMFNEDIKKIENFFYKISGDRTPYWHMFEEYYRNMKLNMYGYLLELGFKSVRPTTQDLNDAGLSGNPDLFKDIDPDKLKNGQTDFVFQECENLQIGCHIKNMVGYLSYKVGQIFSAMFSPLIGVIKNIWNGFAEIIKGIFTWLWEGIKTFLSPIFTPILEFFKPLYTDIVQPVWQFFWSFFDPLWKVATGKTDVHSFLHGDQNRICALQTGYYVEHNAKWNEKPAEFFQILFFLANPKLPADNSQICTSLGMKQVQYGKNTLLDTTLFLIFFATGIWFSLFIIRPR